MLKHKFHRNMHTLFNPKTYENKVIVSGLSFRSGNEYIFDFVNIVETPFSP